MIFFILSHFIKKTSLNTREFMVLFSFSKMATIPVLYYRYFYIVFLCAIKSSLKRCFAIKQYNFISDLTYIVISEMRLHFSINLNLYIWQVSLQIRSPFSEGHVAFASGTALQALEWLPGCRELPGPKSLPPQPELPTSNN